MDKVELKNLKRTPDRFFLPRQIARMRLIVDRKGKGNYERVLFLIRQGRLPAVNYSTGKKRMYRVYAKDILSYLKTYERAQTIWRRKRK